MLFRSMSCQNCGVRVGIGFVFEFSLGWSGVTFEIGFKGEFTPSMTLRASMSGDLSWKREKPVPFISAQIGRAACRERLKPEEVDVLVNDDFARDG